MYQIFEVDLLWWYLRVHLNRLGDHVLIIWFNTVDIILVHEVNLGVWNWYATVDWLYLNVDHVVYSTVRNVWQEERVLRLKFLVVHSFAGWLPQVLLDRGLWTVILQPVLACSCFGVVKRKDPFVQANGQVLFYGDGSAARVHESSQHLLAEAFGDDDHVSGAISRRGIKSGHLDNNDGNQLRFLIILLHLDIFIFGSILSNLLLDV